MSWECVSLDEAPLEILDGDRGKNYPKQNEFFSQEHCLFLSATNVTKTGFDFQECQFITEQKDEKLRKGKLKRNDIVITTRGTIGNVAHYSDNVIFDHVRINSGMVIIRTDNNELYAPFLYAYFRSSSFFKQVNQLRSGVAQPQLPIRDMKLIEIPLPKIDEQKRIAELISNYDELIENNRRRIQLLEESARLLYKEWFVHLRFPGHEHVKITDGVPEGWEMQTAYDVMDVLSGGTPKTKIAEYWDGDIPFFTPKDTTDCAFTYSTEKMITEQGLSKCNSRLYPKYTIFITARGTVGKLSFAQRPMAMNQSCYALVGKKDFNQKFLYCSLKASIEQFKSRASGAVFDAIVVDTFKRIPFLKPTPMLITQFTDSAKVIFDQVDKLSYMNRKLAQARDILLPRLMNGELIV